MTNGANNCADVFQIKSFLAGSPEVRLALNEGLAIARTGHAGEGVYSAGGAPGDPSAAAAAGVVLDDCNFHEAARLDDFEASRMLVRAGAAPGEGMEG